MEKVRFIYNPYSGKAAISTYLDEIVEIYQKKGKRIEPFRMMREFTLEQALEGVDNSYHHILIAGGDGTVNQVINAVKNKGLDVPVAVLPTGTANDFASLLGTTSNVPRSCRRILDGQVHEIDLATADGKYFVNVFSSGMFTDISQKTPTLMKNTFGRMAYYMNSLQELPLLAKMNIDVRSDEVSYSGQAFLVLVFNGRSAGKMELAYLSDIQDGLLDVLVFKKDNFVRNLQTIFHFLTKDNSCYPDGVLHFKTREVEIASAGDEVTDVDGEGGPPFPVKISCLHKGLKVICPTDIKPSKKYIR